MSKRKTPEIGFYLLHKDAQVPEFATEGSACFDLRAFFGAPDFTQVTVFTSDNQKSNVNALPDDETKIRSVVLRPGDRALIPLGYIMDIPAGYSVRFHPRSGSALKWGLTLANGEGVIDSDYVEPVFVIIKNDSNRPVQISDGDRIAQGELVENVKYTLNTLTERPEQKTTRSGGFGSTGSK